MSATKPQRYRTNEAVKRFFADIPKITVPDSVLMDGEHHPFYCGTAYFTYVSDVDETGPYIMVTRTYRPKLKPAKPVLRLIRGDLP